MANPLVSVVVTTYNQGRYIEETLASVMAQSFTDYEVIVVDDGSTDDTPQRLEPFKDKMKIISQPNAGVAGSRNTGVAAACGKYIAFLDGDDIWREDKLAVQVSAALAHPGSGLIAVDGVQFGGVDTIIMPTLFGDLEAIAEEQESHVTGNFYMHLLQSQLIMTTSQVMVPSAVLKAIGPSDPRIELASDYDLYLRISNHYPFTLVLRPLVHWRYLPSSASGAHELRSLRYLPADIEILKKNSLDADAEALKTIRKSIGYKCRYLARLLYNYGRKDGKRRFAIHSLIKLLYQNPNSVWVAVYLIGLCSPQFIVEYCAGRLRIIRDVFKRSLSLSE